MSNRYKGAVISATPPTLVVGAGASGVWTLEQQMQANAAGLWPVNGPFYIEDVFSTYLYTGNSLTQTITNNIDLSTKGGLVWIKSRNTTFDHMLLDTARGVTKYLNSNNTAAESTNAFQLTSFNSNGFTLGDGNFTNNSAYNYASWTFREQPKFFDIVTWTGTGANRTIAHALGSVPGCIMVKRTDTTGDWQVYHRSLANTQYLVLNSTAAAATGATRWNSTTPTSSVFSLGTDATVNASAGTYIAYIFAHDAGGFGLTGTDNVISCGDFTTDGSGNATVTLGYEPQYILMKLNVNGAVNWVTYDIMRGWGLGNVAQLYPNITQAEDAYTGGPYFFPTATGFVLNGTFGLGNNQTNAYIAIRRGPMRVPTVGTSVYNAVARTGTNANATISGVGFSPDLILGMTRSTSNKSAFVDRLRGINPTAYLQATATDAESSLTTNMGVTKLTMDGISVDIDNTVGYVNFSTRTYSTHFFKRAPSFFDEVCYTGTGAAATISHNLGVVPDLIIIKNRGAGGTNWAVNVRSINTNNWVLNLEEDVARFNNALFSSAPTSTTMTFTGAQVNATSNLYVAWLFATCPGVSKVGSYTGTGTTQTINCGFTAGSRFVLIKRTDSTGDWYVWDSARGIIAGNDPYLLLNSTAAEVTGTDYVDTAATGFEISSTAPAAINANGGSFIFLAIA